MEPVASETLPSDERNQEYRVQVTSKKQVTEQINKYKDILKTALDGQPDVAEETKRVLLQELLANFEAAVQDNLLVNGQPWEEAPDAEAADEAVDLESLLDDTIVETTRRRRVYPRQILPHVIHSLKAERKLLGLYEHTVKPQEVVKDPDQESIMNDLSAAAPGMVKQSIQVIKSINTLQKQAEGLCEILSMTPSHATLEIHREVFGFNSQSGAPLPPVNGAARVRQPIRRAVEEAAATCGYVPLNSSCHSHQKNSNDEHLCEGCEGSEGDDRRVTRREKNRVAAQKSRKRQTQRADLLHETCELLEQRNRKLRREVDSLSEEQRLLTEALRSHEPFCPIMHCSFASSSSPGLQPDSMAARSV